MDIQTMAGNPNRLVVVLIVVALVLLMPGSVLGQYGACPDDTHNLVPPAGGYPAGNAYCQGNADNHWDTLVHPNLPCGSGLQVYSSFPLGDEHTPLTIVPLNGLPFASGLARVRFQFTAQNTLNGFAYNGDVAWQLQSYNPARQLVASQTINSTDPTRVSQVETDLRICGLCAPNTQTYHIVNTTIAFTAGGYLKLTVLSPSLLTANNYFYTAVQVHDSAAAFPDQCPVPGVATPTPSPTITWTPTPSDTPPFSPTPGATPTPSDTPPFSPTPSNTPNPTEPPPSTTWTPQATSTIPPLNTMPAESTPTPYPTTIIATLTLPTVPAPPSLGEFPTAIPFSLALTPNATGEARLDDWQTRQAEVAIIATSWFTQTETALGILNVNITNTTGISTPLQIAGELTRYVNVPFSYYKFLKLYMPNLWPLLAFLFLALIWIFFNLFVKWGIAILTTILELFRRAIELIPVVE